MLGRYCRVEALDADAHAASLHAANCADLDGRSWTYLAYGPFPSKADYSAWVRSVQGQPDPIFHAIVDARSGEATGVASYLRIVPEHGVVEVGHIHYAPALQRTPAATEAMYLMMRRAFDELGYRRYEWKCDRLNAASRRAAERLGFVYEGTFRNAVVVKGRNRDTAWFAVTDARWPALREAFERWLEPANFDAQGRQRQSLSQLREGPRPG